MQDTDSLTNPDHDGADLLTTPEVAALARVSRETVARWAKDGILRTAMLLPGGQRRFRRSDVEALLDPATAEAAS